jgi:hypothetical protein
VTIALSPAAVHQARDLVAGRLTAEETPGPGSPDLPVAMDSGVPAREVLTALAALAVLTAAGLAEVARTHPTALIEALADPAVVGDGEHPAGAVTTADRRRALGLVTALAAVSVPRPGAPETASGPGPGEPIVAAYQEMLAEACQHAPMATATGLTEIVTALLAESADQLHLPPRTLLGQIAGQLVDTNGPAAGPRPPSGPPAPGSGPSVSRLVWPDP